MTRKLLLVLVNVDPSLPTGLGVPLYHAAVAAAMDYEVDVVCTAASGRLMCGSVAASVRMREGHAKTALDWIREASANGARFWACPAALEAASAGSQDLIAECAGQMGAATLLEHAMSDDCRVLTY